jgi:hypothetical protein
MALVRPKEKTWNVRQPPEPYMRLPSAGCFLGPTASGKTSTAVALITTVYKGCFDQVWLLSPSSKIDSTYEPLVKHIEGLKNKGGFLDEWDLGKITEIIDEQRKVVAEEKLKNQKTPLTSCLICIDDYSDHPEYMKAGIITQLFLRNRHYNLSVFVLSQKMTSVSLTCRVNFRWILVWRLRSHKEMECVLHELSAIYPVKTLLEMYNMAVSDAPYSFMFVNMSAAVETMFWVRFEETMLIT